MNCTYGHHSMNREMIADYDTCLCLLCLWMLGANTTNAVAKTCIIVSDFQIMYKVDYLTYMPHSCLEGHLVV